MKFSFTKVFQAVLMVLFAAGFAMSLAVPAYAQVATGDINGRITDTSNAVVPGASITVSNLSTGFSRSTVSSETGEFAITLLPPGTYELKVEMKGFATVVQKSMEINVGAKVHFDVQLKPASLAETITVDEASALVEPTKSDLGGVVSPKEVQDLPLLTRTFASLTYIIPEARPAVSYDPTKTRVGTISMAGGDGRNVSINVDGGNDKDNVVGGLLQNFTIEGIQEFQVETHRFSAEAAHSQGGIINVISKSGTNEFHGSGFGFFRDRSLRMQDFFENQTQAAGDCGTTATGDCKPTFNRQQFGGSAGGPLIKDKLFVFGAFEHVRERSDNIVNSNLAPEIKLVPTANFVPVIPTPFDDTQYTIKFDHIISERQRMGYRFAGQKNASPNDQVASPADTDLTGGNTDTNRFFDLVVNHSYTLSPTKVNQFTFHFQDFVNKILGVTTNPNVIFPSLPDGVGANVNVPQETDIRKWQFRDDFSFQVGRHNMKVGVDETYMSKLGGSFFFGANGYQVTFFDDPSKITSNHVLYPQGFATPGAIQEIDFFGGSGTFSQTPHQLGFYVQDDFKVTPRLTLNLGLRWDANINFLNDQSNNRTMKVLGQINNPIAQQDLTRTSASLKEFQPRVGFAWDPHGNGKSVIRGGYGIYYDQVFQNLTLFSLQQTNATIYQQLLQLTASKPPGTPGCQGPLCSFSWNFDPNTLPKPTGTNTDIAEGAFGRINDPDIKDAYSQQWSIGGSHEFARDFVFAGDYVHVLGIHEPRVQNINPAVNGGARLLASAFVAAGLPADRLGQINMIGSTNRSRYDGLTLQLKRRFSRKMLYQVSYVLSKSQSWGGRPTASYSGNGIAIVPSDQFLPGEFGPTLFDERHRFVFSGVFDLPFGIELSPILQLASARPYDFLAGRDLNGDGRSTNDRVCVGSTLTTVISTPGCQEVSINILRGGVFADGSKAPGRFFETDLRVTKTFSFKDRYKALGYLEFYNLFNTANFGNNFQANASASNFAQPTGFLGRGGFGNTASVPAFTVQLGARFTW
ncbi:MAG: TonB-dependent receptor [Terriglobia bacterium]